MSSTAPPAASRAVLITGCSTGIGRMTAERLGGRGWTVYATARDPGAIADLTLFGCKVLALDVCDEASRRAAVAAVEAECGAVGILINNAGYGQEGAIEEVPMAAVRRQFETNVFGLVHLTQLVLPGMRRQGWGRIVNLSSVGGRLTLPGGGIYHASKHAIEAISDALRFEVRPFGIDVILIEPGPIKSRFGYTAVQSLHGLADTTSPYDAFNAAVKLRIRSAFEGPIGRFVPAAIAVARLIEKAISTPRPRPRYVLTAPGRLMLALRRVLPDRAFDALLRTQFPRP